MLREEARRVKTCRPWPMRHPQRDPPGLLRGELPDPISSRNRNVGRASATGTEPRFCAFGYPVLLPHFARPRARSFNSD